MNDPNKDTERAVENMIPGPSQNALFTALEQ